LKYRKSRLRDVRTDLYRRSPIYQHMSYSISTHILQIRLVQNVDYPIGTTRDVKKTI
jgi:hypothetical protein